MANAHKESIVGFKVAHFEAAKWTPVDNAVSAGKLSGLPVMIDFEEMITIFRRIQLKGKYRLECEMTMRAGAIVYDLNGIAEPEIIKKTE